MSPAIVLLSGGLDSATTLAIARSEGRACHCLSVDYGQRHRAELDAAARVARALGADEHRVTTLDLTAFGGSALTDSSIAVPVDGAQEGIPITYVPARNTIFLALALAFAEVRGAADVYFGANAVDYSGYPDCRPEYMRAFEALANLATKAAVTGRRLTLHTPVIDLGKADIIRRGTALGVDYSLTVSCYQASAEGFACGRCESCRLRRAGFEAAGIPDPTRYAA
jgi:7-cyano-7-deazaguanine synthase